MRRLLLIVLACCAAAYLPCAAKEPDYMAEELGRVSFAWGAQLGGAIDMSGQNMSSIDFYGIVGMRYKWIKLFGVGVGADIMVSNSCRSYPVFASFRTDFLSKRRGLLFLDTRAGIANNTFPGSVQRTGFYGYAGLGINLATGRRFASFMSLGYTMVQRGYVTVDGGPDMPSERNFLPHLHCASVSFGVVF
ncbi:MAG: hypothetical protein K2F77_07135 [Muribaculaceae bacterium]|nr:hypothetical protein [Muribaculaceae bacterium]